MGSGGRCLGRINLAQSNNDIGAHISVRSNVIIVGSISRPTTAGFLPLFYGMRPVATLKLSTNID